MRDVHTHRPEAPTLSDAELVVMAAEAVVAAAAGWDDAL